MQDWQDLSKKMRTDWDRRIQHDYRFWMSDGWSSDEVMWASGQRDLDIILQDLTNTTEQSFLEIGCGVGRLLRSAAARFKTVTGLDVSEQAIKQARDLLADINNVNLILGNGVDLNQIPTTSQDCVISYAALTSMPTDVIAAYLREMQRVLKPNGVVRLQVYIGKEQPVHSGDTLHLRCYTEQNLRKALELAGFETEWITELKLPFQVSFKEVGIEAVIISLKKSDCQPVDITQISQALLPNGEVQETEIVENSALEYWMSVNYAKELAELGLNDKARDTLEYASIAARNAAIDVGDSLNELIAKFDQAEKPKVQASINIAVANLDSNGDFFERNLRALQDSFPEVHKQVLLVEHCESEVTTKSSTQGPVIYLKGQCLDHPDKPISAAENWVRQTLTNQRLRDAQELLVFGWGSGYHIQVLLDTQNVQIKAIEPNIDVFIQSMHLRDLSGIFTRIKGLYVGCNLTTKDIDAQTELIVRPQTQNMYSEFYQKVRASFYGARGLSTLKPKIAVLGPIAGGTLPILSYCNLGLQLMQQRVRELNMSPFATGYGQLEQIINNDMIRAVSVAQYVDMLSKLVVNAHTEKPFDILLCMAQAPMTGEALTELRKRGVITVLWFVEDYLRFTSWKDFAQFYDFIFTIQRGDCIQKIKAAGCPEVHYLPTACDPLVHVPMSLSPEDQERWGSPISFVGAGYHNRQQVFASLANRPFKIWGTEWPTCRPFDRLVQEEGRRLTPGEYIKIFNASEINLNLHSSTERDGVDPTGDFLNPRVFELASCKAFQLADTRSLLTEIFTPGIDIATFNTADELHEKIDYYLQNPDERQAIAEAGFKTVRDNHTYIHRLQEMLSVVYASRYEQLKAREDGQPWKKIISRAEHFPELKERCVRAYERGEEPVLDGLVSDIVTGKGQLSETEMRLLFLYHVSTQIIRLKREGADT